MSILCSQIKKITILKNIYNFQAKLIYPKVIIFEDFQNIRIVDIKSNNEEVDDCEEFHYRFNHEIIDYVFQNNYLWIILKSNEIVAIDVIKGTEIKIQSDNYENYKFHKLKIHEGNLFVISESGECLANPYTVKELIEKFEAGITEDTVSLRKAHVHHSALELKNYNQTIINELTVYIDDGNLILKCSLTGLYEIISTNIKLKYVVPWGNVAVLANELNMWIVDIKYSQLIFEYENVDKSYYPLSAHNDIFYYLQWNKTEICVCCTWNTSTSLADKSSDSIYLSDTTPKLTSQETSKQQLKSLVEMRISTDKSLQVEKEMQCLFDKIDDFVFLINMVSKLYQHNITCKPILHSLQKRIFVINDNNLIYLLRDIMIKRDVLDYINFLGNKLYEDLNLFEQNFKQLCITFISNSDFDLASICWLKYSEIKLTITADDIIDIVNNIPNNIKMGALIIWLKNFIPSLLDENPYYIDLFVKWTTKRVFTLEQSGYWPKIGLKFLEEITNILESSLKTIVIRPISMDDLDILKDRIHYIVELKEKYKINMLLGELSSQNPSEIAHIMLRRCYTEDLESFLQYCLPSYATRHSFEVDNILHSYIEIEAASCGGGIDGSRLSILLDGFHSLSSRLDCLLQVLKVLDVPWNPIVSELAVAAAASVNKDFTLTDTDRTLVQEIQKELNYAKVKIIIKKYNFPLTCTDYGLLLLKLINAPIVDLTDLGIISSVMPTYTNYGSILYIDRCLRDCEIRMALHYFKNLSNREKKLLLKIIITKYEQLINSDKSDATFEKNYLDFLKGTQMLNEIEETNIDKLYHLKNSYNIILSLNSFYNEKTCANEVINWKNNQGTAISSGMGGCMIQLTNAYESRNSAIIVLLRRSSTTHKVRDIIETLITSYPNEEYMCPEKINIVLSKFNGGRNTSLLLDSYHVLVELVINSDEEHLHYLIKYLSIINALINANIIVKNLSVAWKFHYIFLPMLSVTATNELINFYKNILSRSNVDLTAISNRSDYVSFKIMANIMEYSVKVKKPLDDDYFEIRNKIATRFLTKIVASQDLDELLITILLLILSTYENTEDTMWILETLKGQNESLSSVVVNYLSSPFIRRIFVFSKILSGSSASYPPQQILKSKYNLNLTEIALPDITEETWDVKVLLLYILRQYPNTSYDRLLDLCGTLNISVNDGLSLQLISLLTIWDLKYKIINDDFASHHLCIENNERELLSKSFTIWNSITNKEFLIDILNDFWKNGEVTLHGRLISINPYYYEVYLCIYHLLFGTSLELRCKKEYFLLNFLKDYRRKSSPKQYEYELFSVKGIFPEIGHYRLPFHLFMREDMWSNLKSEITLETYERWLPAVTLLSLDSDLQTARDMICSNALKQTMTSRKRCEYINVGSKENEIWRLTTREEPLLRAAHKCVKNIANMEWAGACLFYVLQGCAPGADQVAAAQLCYQFTQRWAALQPGNRAVRQMERLHSTYSTRHTLHKIDWACEEFVRLSTEPAQLIRALYLHPRFIEKITRHDINRAANEIADKNGVNISSIRIQILENLLEKTKVENKSILGLDIKDLMVAKYILKATCPKMGAIYLSRIAFDDDSDYNKCKKLRALQCLMSIIEPDTAIKVTNQDRNTLWTSLLDLLYVVNLENIDMPWIVATFMQNKICALEQLIQNTKNTEGLKIVAELTRRYGNVQMIRDLLPSLLCIDLHEEMIPLLLKLSSPPDETVYCAWRAVILSPFLRADYPITERQRLKCLNAINLLPVCPVIKDEDLIEIWKNCVRCKCFGIGCLVLPYMTSQARSTLSELQKIDRRNLIANLKNLHTETYLVPGAMHIVESMASRNYRL